MDNDFRTIVCRTPDDFERAKSVTADYMKWLDMDLCFQNIEKELELFHIMYAGPQGAYIYAVCGNEPAGGVACRRMTEEICEMKRLFVYPGFRGRGIGRRLCEQIIATAKGLSYRKMRLDTVARLDSAITLYGSLGFYDIEKYCDNPDATARFMELDLDVF